MGTGRPTLFVDDGGVMNDGALRAPDWRRLLGEFFPPVLGGTPEAWAEANRVVFDRLWQEYDRTMRGRSDVDFGAYYRTYRLDWVRGMCDLVAVRAPAEEKKCLDLADRAAAYVTRRVRSALSGAAEAIRALRARGYDLHTASGEHSTELAGYLEGMGIRDCFGRLYGPDLVNRPKEGPEYYARIFADVGVRPPEAVVVDDAPIAVRWAMEAGARAVLIGAAETEAKATLRIGALADLPDAIERLE